LPDLTRRKLHAISLGLFFSSAITSVARSAPRKNLPFLTGVNFTGLSDEAWSQPSPKGAVDYYIGQKKMNVVRLNFPWEFIQPRLFGPLDEKNKRILQEQIDRITGAGAYVILEFHNYNRRKINGVERIIGEHPDLTSEHFADAWTKMANEWRDNGHVIFELMNEPHDCRTDILVQVSNAAIAAIRATGAENLIMLCGNDWNSMGWQEHSENQAQMLNIVDPLDHFCFDVHHYFDDWSSGKTHNVREEPIASIEAFTSWAKKHGKKGFCGEFGCSVNKRGMDACRELLTHVTENRDVYIGWAWWGAGGPWQPDYEFLLDPFASHTSPTNPDPAGSRTWANPVDRPQMKVLQDFLPKDATPFNAWLIEDALPGEIEALFRHGDFSAPSGNLGDALYLYWCSLWLRLDMQLGSLLPFPLTPSPPAASHAWIDSGPKGLDAHARIADFPLAKPQLRADYQGGVEFLQNGEFLTSSVSLEGKNIYALISADPTGMKQSSTIVAAGDAKVDSGYRISISAADLSMASAKAGPARTKVSDRAKPKILVSAHSTEQHPNNITRWSLSLDTVEFKETDVRQTEDDLFVIGAANLDGDDSFCNTIYDLAIIKNSVSKEDNARIEGRFHWDLGIAHRLPETHPYRRRPPSRG